MRGGYSTVVGRRDRLFVYYTQTRNVSIPRSVWFRMEHSHTFATKSCACVSFASWQESYPSLWTVPGIAAGCDVIVSPRLVDTLVPRWEM